MGPRESWGLGHKLCLGKTCIWFLASPETDLQAEPRAAPEHHQVWPEVWTAQPIAVGVQWPSLKGHETHHHQITNPLLALHTWRFPSHPRTCTAVALFWGSWLKTNSSPMVWGNTCVDLGGTKTTQCSRRKGGKRRHHGTEAARHLGKS